MPSTVDVFVNGAPVASESVPPGPFSIDHLPVLTGAGQLQVVVTDALGRQQVLTQPYYSGTALLRPDLAEYSFELGSIREDYGHRSFAYGDMLGVAIVSARRHRHADGEAPVRKRRPTASTHRAPMRPGRPA